ncbi:MAG: PHP-associated domain-containing protein [Phycisphaerae bacterium]
MKTFAADLHIHTALSPCASEEMTPPAIVQAAVDRGLAMIAICDHNAAGNTAATQEAAGERLSVVAGMEITTVEECHVLGLFPDVKSAEAAASEVLGTLPVASAGDEQQFGSQVLMDAAGRAVGREKRLLAVASGLDLPAAVRLIHEHDGLALAAHVNRPSFSVLSQLGVFPADAGFDAIEVFTPAGGAAKALPEAVAALGLAVVASSDSHYLGDIGSVQTTLVMEAPTFAELVQAMRGNGKREVRVA